MKKLLSLFFSFCFILALYGEIDLTDLTNKARGNDIESQYKLALCYEKGTNGAEKNYKKAFYWYKKAAEKNHPDAAFRVGNYYLTRSFNEPDLTPLAHLPEEVYEIIGIKVDSYYTRDQEKIKAEFINNLNKKAKWEEVVVYYAIAISANHSTAKYIYGVLLFQEELKEFKNFHYNINYLSKFKAIHPADYAHRNDYKYKYFLFAAEKGHPVAQYFLGVCYSLFHPDYDNFSTEALKERFVDNKATGEITNEDKRKKYENITTYLRENRFCEKRNIRDAQNNFLKSSGSNYAPAQHYLANCYEAGKLFIQDYREAAKFFAMAAEQGNPDAQYRLGKYYLTGKDSIAQNPEKAIELLKKAAEQQHSDAQYDLAECYSKGVAVEKDPVKAAEYYKAAADNEHILAEYKYALCCKKAIGVEENPEQSRKYFDKAARGNHADAQYQLGVCLITAYGGEKNDADAAKWFYYAGEKGHSKALYMLANYFAFGTFDEPDLLKIRTLLANSVEKYRKQYETCFLSKKGKWDNPTVYEVTYKKFCNGGYRYNHSVSIDNNPPAIGKLSNIKYAASFYARAAAHGSPEAQYIYAVCFADGLEMDLTPEYLRKFFSWKKELFIQKNSDNAEFWLKKSAENGVAIACYELASLYIDSKDNTKYPAALELLATAAEKYTFAKFMLAKFLFSGKITEKNEAKAEKLFQELFDADNSYGSKIAEFFIGENNLQLAEKWYLKAVEKDIPEAVFGLGVLYNKNKKSEQASELFNKAASLDMIFAVKAFEYYMLEKDYKKALNFTQMAVNSGDKNVLFTLYRSFNGDNKRKFEILLAAADAGHTEAEYLAAKTILENKSSDEESIKKAVSYLQNSADNNYHPSLNLLAKCYVEGRGTVIDLPQAVSYFEQADKNGDGEACFHLAQCYATGNWGKEKDIDQAVLLLYRGAVRGHADSCRQLANYLMFKNFGDCELYDFLTGFNQECGKYKTFISNKNVYRDYYNVKNNYFENENIKKILETVPENLKNDRKKSLVKEDKNRNLSKLSNAALIKHIYNLELLEYTEIAEKLIPVSYDLKLRYFDIHGVMVENFKCALSFYCGAAENGNAYAQYITGLAYLYGVNDWEKHVVGSEYKLYPSRMIGRNSEKAIHYFKLAAEQDNFHAQYYLGLCYMRKNNFDEAFKWLVKSAEKGHKYAQYELGLYYKEKKDFQNAFNYFLLAARQEHPEAQYETAECYSSGQGVEKNVVKMTKWYRNAAANNHLQSLEKLKKFYANAKNINSEEEKEALRWYREKAEGNDHIAQYIYAICYKNGSLEEQSDKNALIWFERSGYRGVVDAQYQAFLSYNNGIDGVEKNISEAKRWLNMASESGHVMAMYYIAVNSIFGLEYKLDNFDFRKADHEKLQAVRYDENLKKLLSNFRKVAESGFAPGQYLYGYYLMYCIDDHSKSYKGRQQEKMEAANWFYKAAGKGLDVAIREFVLAFANDLTDLKDKTKDPDTVIKYIRKVRSENKNNNAYSDKDLYYAFAKCYFDGYGCKKNIKTAVKYYEEAAQRGHTYARYRLALCYRSGIGVKRSTSRAEELLNGLDIPEAEYELGEIFFNRRKTQAREAFEKFQSSAQKGYVNAIAYLGRCYQEGIGTEKNPFLTFYYYSQAAENNHRAACYQLGLCYLHGKGTAKNVDSAVEWLKKAADLGSNDAKVMLKNLGY